METQRSTRFSNQFQRIWSIFLLFSNDDDESINYNLTIVKLNQTKSQAESNRKVCGAEWPLPSKSRIFFIGCSENVRCLTQNRFGRCIGMSVFFCFSIRRFCVETAYCVDEMLKSNVNQKSNLIIWMVRCTAQLFSSDPFRSR